METHELHRILWQGSVGGGEPRMSEYTGTKALMLAVLEEGVRSYCGPHGPDRAEAEHWVAAADRRSPFSFVVVCETLGLEPTAVRRALQTQQAQAGTRAAVNRLRGNARRQRTPGIR